MGEEPHASLYRLADSPVVKTPQLLPRRSGDGGSLNEWQMQHLHLIQKLRFRWRFGKSFL